MFKKPAFNEKYAIILLKQAKEKNIDIVCETISSETNLLLNDKCALLISTHSMFLCEKKQNYEIPSMSLFNGITCFI